MDGDLANSQTRDAAGQVADGADAGLGFERVVEQCVADVDVVE